MHKPHEAEEDYFAKIEAEKKRKLAEKKRAEMQTKEVEALKEAHHMRCPGCGLELDTLVFKGLSINRCFHCGGVFLGKEAFESLCGEEHNLLSQIWSVFGNK